MPKLSAFEPIAGMDGFWVASNGKLNCVAIRLGTGGLCLYSPAAGLGAETLDSLAKLGSVEVLLAPNHYHNKALVEYQAAFSQAQLLATAEGAPRLTNVTGLAFDLLEDVGLALPDGAAFVMPKGLKTGEVWIATQTGLIVVDAFAGPAKPGGDPALLKTFPRYGVGYPHHYKTWAKAFVAQKAPTRLVPCHGQMVTDKALPEKLIALIEGAI